MGGDENLIINFYWAKTQFSWSGSHVYQNTIGASLLENRLFANAKTKTQISFTVTAKLISAFVFPTQKVQFLYFPNPKFQASSHLL